MIIRPFVVPTPHTTSLTPHTPLWRAQTLLMLCLFAACLVGIFSRPLDFLAAFWPANALMLGLALRVPALVRPVSTWCWGFATYVAADMLTGAEWKLALWLNLANWVGIWVGWMYLSRPGLRMQRFENQRSVLHLFNACVLASLSCMLIAAWPSSEGFEIPMWQSLLLWFSSEFYNYVLIVPVFLAAPAWKVLRQRATQAVGALDVAPLLVLVVSECVSLLVPGPGSIAFIMPAMVWCAMRYGVLPTTLISLLLCMWKASAVVLLSGAFHFGPSHVFETMSYRVGLALLSLAPLAVACAEALRMQAMQKLHDSINHDFLTGALSRRAWMERGYQQLARLRATHQPVSVLMLDLDHFKKINDQYGHAQGDVVLQGFVQLAQQHLRPEDLLGRMGGEEFALLLPNTTSEQAQQIGQRLCESLRQHPFALGRGEVLQVTASIGVQAAASVGQQDTLETLLSQADEALYAAKTAGRDQVRQWAPAPASPALAPAML